MKKIELTMEFDFNGYWKDEIEGIDLSHYETKDTVYNEMPEFGSWGYYVVVAKCDRYEDVSYIDSERKRFYLETVNMIGDIAYPRTWSTEKPESVKIVDWE